MFNAIKNLFSRKKINPEEIRMDVRPDYTMKTYQIPRVVTRLSGEMILSSGLKSKPHKSGKILKVQCTERLEYDRGALHYLVATSDELIRVLVYI
ncbi:MAG: hypothetical protein Q4A21_03405 [bacterium]|nr:hypothetical protein [bacterium]